MGKNCMLQWEYKGMWYAITLGLLAAVVAWVAMLVIAASIEVGLLVVLCDAVCY